MDHGQMYIYQKDLCDFVFADYSNACPICYSLWEILNLNKHDLYFDL